ncbi:hypothetical protein [Photobacterium arenosum]|uniref:hypothetical protein n=1 Tax=Photobacterium arenosum TaxID=2774143 RepID=UPI002889640D|nr:hypothetical protein [Photobacterium arenosum]
MNQRPQFDLSGSTVGVTQAVIDALTSFKGADIDIGKVATISRHQGRFASPAAVKSEVTGQGAIRVTALRVDNVRKEAGSIIGTVSLVAFVMTNDHYGWHRDIRAEVIASQLALTIARKDWPGVMGRVAYKQADRITSQNLCTDALDEVGVAIWSVSWQQECRLNVPVDINSLDDFLTLGLTAHTSDQEQAPKLNADIKVRQ